MPDLAGRPPIGQKVEKPPQKARKRIPKQSAKRKAYMASDMRKAALDHMRLVKAMACIICDAPGPSDAHHVFCGRYGSRKASDFEVIPLCKWCHQNGPESIHRNKAAWVAKNGPDTDYLPLVNAAVRIGRNL